MNILGRHYIEIILLCAILAGLVTGLIVVELRRRTLWRVGLTGDPWRSYGRTGLLRRLWRWFWRR